MRDEFAAVIAADPAALERLFALDSWFANLKQPSALWPISARATIEQVAETAGVPVASVLAAINAGAVAPCCASEPAVPGEASGEEAPEWFASVEPTLAARVDVRPILAAREEPFAPVMREANAVPPGGAFLIDVPFNPQPLRQVLEAKGFLTYGRRLAPRHWEIWCLRTDAGGQDHAAAAPREHGPRTWWVGNAVHIDVRGLEAPAPLTAILSLIDGGEHRGRIVVHHHRDPLYLYPELQERGWQYKHLPSPEGEFRLELRQDR